VTTPSGPGVPMAGPNEPATAQPATGESPAELLQSMLSHAVEGQLDEQRELAGAIDDMRSQLMRMGQEIADLRVRAPRDDAADAQINSVTVELREAVRFLSERLDGVTRMLALRGEEFADVRTALAALDTHLRTQADTIAELSVGVAELPSYGERMSILQDNVRALHLQLVGIDAALKASDNSGVLARLDVIETALAAHASDDIGERLSAVSAEVEAAVAPVAQLLSQISAGTAAQAAILAQLQQRLDPIATDITAIGGDVAGLVEGSAAGAALDSRVNESVTEAMRETERRLTVHIDEAVLALAQALLRRRITSPAVQPGAPTTTAPPVEQPEPEPAPESPSAAEPEPPSAPEPEPPSAPEPEPGWAPQPAESATAPADPVDPEPVAEVEESAPIVAPTAWWEQEMATIDPAPGSEADLDLDLDLDLDNALDLDRNDYDYDAPAVDGGAIDVEPQHDDETQVGEPTADDPFSTTELPRLVTADSAEDSDAEHWSPERPPARDPADPTLDIAPDRIEEPKRRRRWF
jgi:uncharacterized coiled-coil protein SlyX